MYSTISPILIINLILQLTVIGQLNYVQHDDSIPVPCCSLSCLPHGKQYFILMMIYYITRIINYQAVLVLQVIYGIQILASLLCTKQVLIPISKSPAAK
jgi:hypothetical protein